MLRYLTIDVATWFQVAQLLAEAKIEIALVSQLRAPEIRPSLCHERRKPAEKFVFRVWDPSRRHRVGITGQMLP